jgi:hypothetical protein
LSKAKNFLNGLKTLIRYNADLVPNNLISLFRKFRCPWELILIKSFRRA